MCPFCFGTLGLVVTGTVSTGGLAALVVRLSRTKDHAAEPILNANTRGNENSKEK